MVNVMEKTIDATYDGDVFRPDEPVDLEPNTEVRLTLVVKKRKKKGRPYAFFEYARSVSIDAPADFASNIDDYLYGGKSFGDE